jgi:hypothetical protein
VPAQAANNLTAEIEKARKEIGNLQQKIHDMVSRREKLLEVALLQQETKEGKRPN